MALICSHRPRFRQCRSSHKRFAISEDHEASVSSHNRRGQCTKWHPQCLALSRFEVVRAQFASAEAVAQSAPIEYHSSRSGRLVCSHQQVYLTIFKTLSKRRLSLLVWRSLTTCILCRRRRVARHITTFTNRRGSGRREHGKSFQQPLNNDYGIILQANFRAILTRLDEISHSRVAL